MSRIAIIGAGISGLSTAHFLKNKYDIKIFEKDAIPGGLIKCNRVNGSLFHTCGGHVFNSKRQDVLDWFWSFFSREKAFSKTERNSVVFMDDGKVIPYPIENHMYFFDVKIQNSFIEDLVSIAKSEDTEPDNFEDFLKGRFGNTLYDMYFQPYNKKVWRRDLKQIPLTWLEGKLPMPTVQEMIFNNINHVEEKAFVHSTFWYEKKNGSQYVADMLADGLNIIYNVNIDNVQYEENQWRVCGEKYDKVIFCGNIKDMVKMIKGVDIESFKKPIDTLEYHGTTAVFCEIDKNPYSWIYQPSCKHESHRIICTGNFSNTNNDASVPQGRITATIEFTDEISKEDILNNLKHIPFNPKYIKHQYNKFTYPIQDSNTRNMIGNLKRELSSHNFFFTGRFADWEYYNMDAAIGAAMDLCKGL
jgi:protoporphyrinogen oxidase